MNGALKCPAYGVDVGERSHWKGRIDGMFWKRLGIEPPPEIKKKGRGQRGPPPGHEGTLGV